MITRLRSQAGLTLIETLVAMVILFVGVALALRLQSNLEAKLQVSDLDRAILLADSLLLEIEERSTKTDSAFVIHDEGRTLTTNVTLGDSAGMWVIRIAVHSDSSTRPIHQLYREFEMAK